MTRKTMENQIDIFCYKDSFVNRKCTGDKLSKSHTHAANLLAHMPFTCLF